MIAEDEALIRLDLAEMLAEEGYDVVGQAADGEKAVALAEELRPDLVILDVKMPRLDGIAAAEQIASAADRAGRDPDRLQPARPVERARDAGAMAYLVKPFTGSDLVPAIEMAVSPLRRGQRARDGGRRPGGAAGDAQERSTGPRACCRSSCGISEPEAFRWIQKTAMDLRLSMREVAEGVVRHGPGLPRQRRRREPSVRAQPRVPT